MSQAIYLDSASFTSVPVTTRTEWTFAEITDSEGITEVVEITSGENTRPVAALIGDMLASLKDIQIPDESQLSDLLGLESSQLQGNQIPTTALSALRTAVSCLQARHQAVSLTEALGGTPRVSVQLYANINRSLLGDHRTAAHFAAAAGRAVASGYSIIKCAPFDEVHPPSNTSEIMEVAREGIERVTAVRVAVGPDVQVLVDCHSRFEALTAPMVAEKLWELQIGWFEEPVSPTENANELAQIARQVSMPIAGGESGYGTDFFDNLIQGGAVNVIMPDIKFCGGVAEAYRAGISAIKARGQISLHNPSGPMSQLGSAHVTAAISGSMPLEHAVGEAEWRAEILSPPERIYDGRLWFPEGHGIGAALNQDLISLKSRKWRA
jgi:galactonate dehydratase